MFCAFFMDIAEAPTILAWFLRRISSLWPNLSDLAEEEAPAFKVLPDAAKLAVALSMPSCFFYYDILVFSASCLPLEALALVTAY